MKQSDASARPPDRAQVYAAMVGALETELGGEKLSALLAGIRDGAPDADGAGLTLTDDILRPMGRLGWLGGLTGEAQRKRGEEILREFAAAVDRDPVTLGMLFRVYADGWYGVLPRGICANPPQCRKCGLTRWCAHYNAPPPPKARERALSPVERLRQRGAEALNDEEILGLVLGAGQSKAKASALAGDLLARYGSLRKLSRTSPAELESYAAVSRTVAVRLIAAFALADRMSEEARRQGPVVRSGKDFYDLYGKRLRDLRQEVFLVVLLDQRNRILRDEQVSQGSLTGALVHPREVFAPAIRESAAAVALVHNHPSGDPTPSREDREITTRLQETAGVVGIRLLDHIIIGEACYTSFIDEGWL
ncbi:MAG: RadC family protein [Planctomycetota bacterium]